MALWKIQQEIDELYGNLDQVEALVFLRGLLEHVKEEVARIKKL